MIVTIFVKCAAISNADRAYPLHGDNRVNPASKESLSDILKAPKASVRYSFNDAFLVLTALPHDDDPDQIVFRPVDKRRLRFAFRVLSKPRYIPRKHLKI